MIRPSRRMASHGVLSRGCEAFRHRRFEEARRFYLRYFLAGLASSDTKLQSAGVFNLAVVLSHERRWIRAFGLGVIAAASSLGDKTTTQEIAVPFLARILEAICPMMSTPRCVP